MEEEKKQDRQPVPASEIEIICLPVRPLNKKTPKEVSDAKRIARNYLNIGQLEQILKKKKENRAKAQANRFRAPETPEEFYERGQKYLAGARCAVPFEEQSDYYRRAAEMFAGAGEYQDAPRLARTYAALADTIRKEGSQSAYEKALERKEKAVTANDWFMAARAFERLSGYEQADQYAEECERRLEKMHSARIPLLIGALVIIAGLLFGGVRLSHHNAVRYQAAKAADAIGFESAAVSLFQQLDGYRDSTERYQSCQYRLGVEAMEAGHFSTARKHFANADDYPGAEELRLQTELEVLRAAETGDRVSFGKEKYILLDREGERVLLLDEKLYGDTPYSAARRAVTWAQSDLRTALNSDYLQEKFTAEEQALVLSTQISADATDQIFLLSKEEYLVYQPVMGSKDALWWLRDNGASPDTAAFVSCDGTLMAEGYPVDSSAIQGRAALWVQLD